MGGRPGWGGHSIGGVATPGTGRRGRRQRRGAPLRRDGGARRPKHPLTSGNGKFVSFCGVWGECGWFHSVAALPAIIAAIIIAAIHPPHWAPVRTAARGTGTQWQREAAGVERNPLDSGGCTARLEPNGWQSVGALTTRQRCGVSTPENHRRGSGITAPDTPGNRGPPSQNPPQGTAGNETAPIPFDLREINSVCFVWIVLFPLLSPCLSFRPAFPPSNSRRREASRPPPPQGLFWRRGSPPEELPK